MTSLALLLEAGSLGVVYTRMLWYQILKHGSYSFLFELERHLSASEKAYFGINWCYHDEKYHFRSQD